MGATNRGVRDGNAPRRGRRRIGLLIVLVLVVGGALWLGWLKDGIGSENGRETEGQAETGPRAPGNVSQGAPVDPRVQTTDLHVGPDGQWFMTAPDGRVIPVNVGLPQAVVIVERQGVELGRFSVEVADSPRAQQIGLMGRTALAPEQGMLFTWEPPEVVSMWMKDTLIPLDMLYVRADGVIAAVGHRVPPCPPAALRCPTYPAPEPVAHVVELAAGRAREAGIRPGDQVVIVMDGPIAPD